MARKHNYVVGFTGERDCVYSGRDYIERMTMVQAKKELIKMSASPGYPARIYKLVPVGKQYYGK